MTVYNKLPVIVHSNLLYSGHVTVQRYQNSIRLYYLVRAVDARGVGKVVFSITQAAYALGCSVKTVKRYLDQARQIGLFRAYAKRGDSVTVYYAAIAKVCVDWGLTAKDLGACAEVTVEDLKFHKELATELNAQKLQEQSRYRSKKQHKRKPIATAKFFESRATRNVELLEDKQPKAKTKKQASDYATGRKTVGWFGNGRFLAAPLEFRSFGGTQATLAKRMGKSVTAVRRRLSTKRREKIGAHKVRRIQVVKYISANPQATMAYNQMCERDCQDNLVYFKDKNGIFRKTFFYHNTPWVYLPNIYDLKWELKSCRWLRKRLDKAFRVSQQKNEASGERTSTQTHPIEAYQVV